MSVQCTQMELYCWGHGADASGGGGGGGGTLV